MKRVSIFVYGVICYVLFLGVFLYAIGFVAGVVVPKGIDDGQGEPLATAIAWNLGLLGLFGVQHSIMARPAFKRLWTRVIPHEAERSTFVLATNAAFALLFWQWRPIATVVWDLDHPVVVNSLHVIAGLGWVTVLVSTFLIDHFDLFGLRQSWLCFRGKPYTQPHFQERALYRFVRHPLLLGFLVAFWAQPTMTGGRLLFAMVVTCYVLVAIRLEERDLVAAHGESYLDYRRRVPGLVPFWRTR